VVFTKFFWLCMNPLTGPSARCCFWAGTGSGKTRVIEAAAEVAVCVPNAVLKIDCAEFSIRMRFVKEHQAQRVGITVGHREFHDGPGIRRARPINLAEISCGMLKFAQRSQNRVWIANKLLPRPLRSPAVLPEPVGPETNIVPMAG